MALTLRQRQSIFAKNIGLLIVFAYANGLEITIGEFHRTAFQQAEYVRTKKSKTMSSGHLIKLAGDLFVFINGILKSDSKSYQLLGEYWMKLHPDNVWGGDWNRNHKLEDEKFLDPYHFEMKSA